MTLREHVARALWADAIPAPWEDGHAEEHDDYYRMADVAIAAVNAYRPEVEMLDADPGFYPAHPTINNQQKENE